MILKIHIIVLNDKAFPVGYSHPPFSAHCTCSPGQPTLLVRSLCDFIGGCSQCAFIGVEQVEMKMHDAKIHSEKFQCALGDIEEKYLDNIEIHLSTCDCYLCGLLKVNSNS